MLPASERLYAEWEEQVLEQVPKLRGPAQLSVVPRVASVGGGFTSSVLCCLGLGKRALLRPDFMMDNIPVVVGWMTESATALNREGELMSWWPANSALF